MSLWFNGVNEPNGWMGNMAPYPITYNGQVWRTSEALFQSMRYEDPLIKEIIRNEKSILSVIMKLKKYRNQMVVVPMTELDVENMRKCVKIKFDQHPQLKRQLMNTKDSFIYEDIGNRNGERHKFWGAKKWSESEGDGNNMMGKILMDLREEYLKEIK